jgi:hypothetical protein
MRRKPPILDNIPLTIAITILVTGITAAISIMTAAYGFRDRAVTSTLSTVDQKLEDYVTYKVWMEKIEQKDQADYNRYYDLRNRIDRVLEQVKKQ